MSEVNDDIDDVRRWKQLRLRCEKKTKNHPPLSFTSIRHVCECERTGACTCALLMHSHRMIPDLRIVSMLGHGKIESFRVVAVGIRTHTHTRQHMTRVAYASASHANKNRLYDNDWATQYACEWEWETRDDSSALRMQSEYVVLAVKCQSTLDTPCVIGEQH